MDRIKVKQEPGHVDSSNKKANSSTESIRNGSKVSKPTKSLSSTKHKTQAKDVIAKTPNIKVKQEMLESLKKESKKVGENNGSSINANSSNSDYEPPSKIKKSKGKSVLVGSSNDKILEFMIQVPELNDVVQNDDSSKFSSPFNSRVDTAGTNLTFLTKGGNTEVDEYKGKDVVHVSDDDDEDHMLKKANYSSGLQFRDSSEQVDSGDSMSFISSPCVDRKMKQKRKKIFEGEVNSVKKQKLDIFNNDAVVEENVSFLSNNATDGSDEPLNTADNKRPSTPKKYLVDNNPIYEYMEGEDAVYHEIMGKNSNSEEFDDNEKLFFEFVHMNFEQWSEQSIAFNKEYDGLMKRVIVARMKFDKRVKFLKDNLDTFALSLEKYGGEINKRSEILKEYCSKIVDEIEEITIATR